MVKFSLGMWERAPNTITLWATESVKAEAKTDSIRVVASTRPINHRGDTLNNPTITTEITSPSPDIIHCTSHHWIAQATTALGPHFELYPHGKPAHAANSVEATKTAAALSLRTPTVSATVDTRPKSLSIDFHDASSHKLLTKLGWRSIGYVYKDVDPHANQQLLAPDVGERWFTYQLQLGVGEKIYGLGERFGPFVKNGQSVDLWNEDGGTSSELAYKNVPFYLSSRGYGVFIATPARVSLEIQSERTTRVNIAVKGEALGVYLIRGSSPKEVLERYTGLTGRPALVPGWSLGLWLSTSFTTSYDEKTVDGFLDGMRERGIATAVFHFDCFWMRGFHWCDFEFDPDMFPDPVGQLRRIKEKGIKVCAWINPYIAQESKLFKEGVDGGYFIKKPDGSVWQYDQWQAGMAYVDFTNPKACEWYKGHLSKLIDMGVDVFKTDFGERIPTGSTVYYDGSDPHKMHNYYPVLYNQVTFEVLEERLGKDQALVFARSATAGVQRFPVHWGGDPMSTYEAMAETLRGGLSLGLCGFGYWAHDIGGFEGKPDPGLFKRWIAFGLLSSHSRLHGSGSFRAPWLIDPSEEASKVLKHFVDLKTALHPYLFREAITAHRTGVPMMRAMLLEFPTDAAVWHLDTQYMLGPSLLVAPVFSDDEPVEYYVPAGKWYGFLDGQLRQGPGYFAERHDFFSLPLLQRPASAVVRADERGLTVVVNEKVGMHVVAETPDRTKPGEIKTRIGLSGDEGGLMYTVEGPMRHALYFRVYGRRLDARGADTVKVDETAKAGIVKYL